MEDLEKLIKPYLRRPPDEVTKVALVRSIEQLGHKVRKVEFSHGKITVRMDDGIIVVTT